MSTIAGSHRIHAGRDSDPARGRVRWAPAKSIWISCMTLATLVLGPALFSGSAFVLFLVTTGITLCFGHSVGMHRRLIHGSFQCPLWLEYLCVYLGTLVGMAGPVGMTRTHDFRDWAQRQESCHDYFCHRRGFWHDAWWQMHCELVLDHAPAFVPERHLADSRFYGFIERRWMAQQLPWAILFFALGGWGWVVWGICARVCVSVTGHWLVGHFAHREGGQSWVVEGAAAQGYNITIAGLISMGESWHNNHHAFPGSARLGLFAGEVDLGWWLILAFERLGLATAIVTPDIMPQRLELRALAQQGSGCSIAKRLLPA
jgi:fatty-acid desaturase